MNYFFKYLVGCVLIIYIFGFLFFIPFIFSHLIAFIFGFVEYSNLIIIHILFFLPIVLISFLFKEEFLNFSLKINKKIIYVVLFLFVYLFIVSTGLNIYYLLVGKWSSADVINIFVLGTYVVAPLVVIWAYIDWKSPKQYELEKQYAEKLLDNINEVYFYMFERVNKLKLLSDIDNNVILLNGLIKNPIKYSDRPFYLAHGYLKSLNSMAKNEIDKTFLTNFERIAQLLDGQSNYIEEKYDLYYEPLSSDLKNNHSITYTTYQGVVLTKEQLFAKYQLSWYMNDKLESEAIEETGEKIIFNLTFKEYIDEFVNEYETLVNEIIVKFIKID
ncbi:hypothetical protein FPL18_16940 [Acinetobacter gyllenbergii]|nr:hypothetical protein FPL18_16940 [Acinetobacter gyllenbergii]